MVQVVAPDGVEAVAVLVARLHEPVQVAVVLGDEVALRAVDVIVHGGRQLRQKVRRALVAEGVGGVEPEAVHVVLAQPVQRVVEEKAPHALGALVVQVDRRAPRRLVLVCEEGPEGIGVGAVRPEMVVDDVQEDGQPGLMRRVHKAAEILGPTVGAGRSEPGRRIVAPVALARKVVHRHQLDGRHA